MSKKPSFISTGGKPLAPAPTAASGLPRPVQTSSAETPPLPETVEVEGDTFRMNVHGVAERQPDIEEEVDHSHLHPTTQAELAAGRRDITNANARANLEHAEGRKALEVHTRRHGHQHARPAQEE